MGAAEEDFWRLNMGAQCLVLGRFVLQALIGAQCSVLSRFVLPSTEHQALVLVLSRFVLLGTEHQALVFDKGPFRLYILRTLE